MIKTIAYKYTYTYPEDTEEYKKEALRQWETQVEGILERNPDIKLHTEPEVLPPRYKDGEFHYDCLIRI